MFFVRCPCCQSPVEIPASAVGPERDDLYNVVVCDVCDAAFDFDDDEVQEKADEPDADRE